MNEKEFLQRWNAEKAMYGAWGHFVVDFISSNLSTKLHKDLKKFLKIPADSRVKDNDSLIDKAFNRNKSYTDPYNDIEDKVGARFVVMLVTEVDDICGLINDACINGEWNATQCRNFTEERKLSPTLFTYQSHHFIIRSNKTFTYKNIKIDTNIPCEVQVRTLLQHAYAELTHNVTYKKKTIIEPEVERTIAKTMAFIETADDFFKSVTEKINTKTEPAEKLENYLDHLFESYTGQKPEKLKSTIIIYDTFKELVTVDTINKISKFITKTKGIDQLIRDGQDRHVFYKQSVIIFVYWLVRDRRRTVESEWPLEWQIISDIALDLNVSLDRYT